MSTHNIPFSVHLNYSKSAATRYFSKGEFETAVVNEPSVFEQLGVYCSLDTFPILFML